MLKVNILIVLMLLVVVAVAFWWSVDENDQEYVMEDYIVLKYDTFWNIYNNLGYYSTMTYSEALYTFKQDNNLTTSGLIERTEFKS